MKKLFVCLMATVLGLSSCQFVTISGNALNQKNIRCKGPVETRSIENLDGFNAVVLNGHSDMTFIQSDDFEVSVCANQEVFEYLDFKTENSTLVIQTRDKVNLRAEKFEVTVKAPALTNLVINGAADLDLADYAWDEALSLQVNGAGDLTLNRVLVPDLRIGINGAGDVDVYSMDVETLSVSVNGAGDAKLTGKAAHADLSVSGAGDIDARGLDCQDIRTSKAGVATIRLK